MKTYFRNRLAGAVLLVLLFVNTLWWAAVHYRPWLEIELQSEEIQPESARSYTVHFANPNSIYAFKGDDSADPRRSNLQVFEDGQALGPPHEVHETIRNSGGGAFSHWGKSLYFSSSDNTDPRINGRLYSVKVRSEVRLAVTGLFLIANGLLILAFGFLFYSAAMISKAAVLGFCAATLTALFLFLNLVPVTHFAGRFFYGAMVFVLVVFILFLIFQESRLSCRTGSISVSLFRKFQLVTSILFLILISLEALCRAFPVPDTLAVNPGCRFFWADWYKYPLNKEGYREREVPAKEEGVYRVLIYGDSYIEGAGVDRASLAGVYLERMLNNRLREAGSSLKVQAYNLGHCGANTKQEAFWIERDAAALKPDLVVLAYVLNDAESDAPALVQTASPLMRVFSSLLTGDHGSYLFYRWLKLSALFFPAAKSPKESRQTYIEALHDDSAAGWQEARRALGRIEEFTRSSSIDQFSVVLPLFMRSVSPDMKRVMEKVSEAMTTLGMENYNTLDYFSGGGLLQYAFSVNDSHPNAEGHRKLAEFLSEKIWNRDSFRKAAAL